jgi:AcrR family transcriptional regulator
LWTETIEAHRHAVHAAILDTAASLVAEHGLASVTMSQVAQAAGIGRATLYKYFPDVNSMLLAWHDKQIAEHLGQLAAIVEDTPDRGQRVSAVLRAYAMIVHGHRDHRLAGLLHHDGHPQLAEQHLHEFVTGLIADAATAGDVRADIPADELAHYCLHAVAAAAVLPSESEVDRLVTVTLAGLRPPPHTAAHPEPTGQETVQTDSRSG